MDPALWEELLWAEEEADGDRVLEAIIRLAQPGIEIPDVRIVSRFGPIATCRIRARDVIAVRARPEVISLKAPRGLSPGFEPAVGPPGSALLGQRPTDVRRSPTLALTGAGVVVACVDWGVDVDSAAFRWPDDPVAAGDHRPGGTRLLSFWDQRDLALGPRPDPYGYGAIHSREEIDRALEDPRPYERLGYHPAIADPRGRGTHGTRTLDIAAGNGRADGPAGIAPDADLVFVHLADRNTGGLANFGDSGRLLEAVDFISRTAGPQPCVINISAGRICGPHDGTALVERALDELLAAVPGRFVVNSAGNYFHWRAHSCGTIAPGEARSLTFVTDPADSTLNQLEVWYDGADEFAVRIDPPGYAGTRPVCLGERADLLIEGKVVGRVYHRKHDPNNGDNHIVAYLDPIGCTGNWTVTLEARRVSCGRFHAWIERDDSCRDCQARFTHDDSNPAITIGSIATSHLPLIVGAYNGHDPARPVATFSSAGPSRDGRAKPDLAAPGVSVLTAQSAPIGASRNPGLLVRGNGTSFATPHVTGAVALCFEAAGNRLSAHKIRSLVLGSCDSVPDADPQSRLGHGYLNIPRLVADVQRTLATPTTAPSPQEPTMDTEDTIVLLAAAPATAYREYLYRPDGQLARWIGSRYDVVARPGQPIALPLQEGDILLEVTLGRIGPGRCVPLAARDLEFVASQRRLAPGKLMLRPRRRVELSESLPVEPTVGTEVAKDIRDRDVDQGLDKAADDPLRRQLTMTLPLLLVDFGDSELRRRDEDGILIYDPVQPLVFAPTGRRYSYGTGGPNYHAANFVFNSAYTLGYEVPVHPAGSRTADQGDAYLNTAASFQALAGANGLAGYLRRFFQVVATPGQDRMTAELREGDLLLGDRDGSLPLGHFSIIADPQLRAMGDPFFQQRDADHGIGVQCIGADQAIHTRADRFGRVLIGEDGRVLADRMAIRFRSSAIDVPRIRERMARDDAFKRTLAQPRSSEGEATALWGAGGLCHHIGAAQEAAEPASSGARRAVQVTFRYSDGSPMAEAVYEARFGDRRVPGRADGHGVASVEVPATHAGPFRLFLRSFPERYVEGGRRP